MIWYKLYIRMFTDEIKIRFVEVDNRWDLFAVIGWLYSTTIEKIERIDYEEVKCDYLHCDSYQILHPPKSKYTLDICDKVGDNNT